MTPKEMQEAFLAKNKITKCPDTVSVVTMQNTKNTDSLEQGVLPKLWSRRFDALPKRICHGCDKISEPTHIRCKFGKRKMDSLFCEKCRAERYPTLAQQQDNNIRAIKRDIREFNLNMQNIEMTSTKKLEEFLILNRFLKNNYNEIFSKTRRKLIKYITIELKSRKATLEQEAEEEIPLDPNVSITGYEFDF